MVEMIMSSEACGIANVSLNAKIRRHDGAYHCRRLRSYKNTSGGERTPLDFVHQISTEREDLSAFSLIEISTTRVLANLADMFLAVVFLLVNRVRCCPRQKLLLHIRYKDRYNVNIVA